MKRHELVKYKYGLHPHIYTAFCITPQLKEPKTVERFGKTYIHTNEGSYSSRSRHFQRPETAKAYAGTNGIEIVDPDWTCIEGTGICGIRHNGKMI